MHMQYPKLCEILYRATLSNIQTIECFHGHAIRNKIKNHSVDQVKNSTIIDDR